MKNKVNNISKIKIKKLRFKMKNVKLNKLKSCYQLNKFKQIQFKNKLKNNIAIIKPYS